MSQDALFEMNPRPPFVTGDRVDLHTLWGVQHGVVAEILTAPDQTHLLVVAIDGVRHAVDPSPLHLHRGDLMLKTVTTTIRDDEVERIDTLWPGWSRAANLRVLIRYGLAHKHEVYNWLHETSGQAYEDEGSA